jgi:ABC-type microcin C transport system permease subunit YejE
MAENSDKQFDHAINQVIKKKEKKKVWLWLLIIFVIAIVVSLFVNFIPLLYDQLIHYNDPSYRPMDLERQYRDLENLRKEK